MLRILLFYFHFKPFHLKYLWTFLSKLFSAELFLLSRIYLIKVDYKLLNRGLQTVFLCLSVCCGFGPAVVPVSCNRLYLLKQQSDQQCVVLCIVKLWFLFRVNVNFILVHTIPHAEMYAQKHRVHPFPHTSSFSNKWPQNHANPISWLMY